MKKLLLGLGSVTSIMPIAAIIACGAHSTKPEPKTTQPDTTSETHSVPSKTLAPTISQNLKSEIASIVLDSNKDRADFNKILPAKNQTWSQVIKKLGIKFPKIKYDKDGKITTEKKIVDIIKHHNKTGIKIDFTKPKNYSNNFTGADEEINLIIKKENNAQVSVPLHLKSLAGDKLFQIRNEIYFWKESPETLSNKKQGAIITPSELGLTKNDFIKQMVNPEEITNFTLKIKKPLDDAKDKIVLNASIKYNNITTESKAITINYNFLTFEAIKNAIGEPDTNINKSILKILKDASPNSKKKDIWDTKLSQLSLNNESKEMFKNYFEKSHSLKDVYYMIKFMNGATDYFNISLATAGIVEEKDDRKLFNRDKFTIVMNKIYSSEFNIIKTAQGIISKFAGDDHDFNSMVQYAAKVDVDSKKLKKGGAWVSASGAMGGDETVKYIISKIGYTLV